MDSKPDKIKPMPKNVLYLARVFYVSLLFLSACTPPNTAPVISQPEAFSLVHNTLAMPEEKVVTFSVKDSEDSPLELNVSATTSDSTLVTLDSPTCDSTGQCSLGLTIAKATVATASVTLRVTDDKAAGATSSFTITVTPEEKTVTTGAELKALLESSPAGSSLKISNTSPVLLDTQILLDKELILWGEGQDKTVFNAQNLDRHFWIKPTGKVTLHDLTLTNGNAQDSGSTVEGDFVGGAVFNEGTLTLENVKITSSKALNRTATSKGKGGAIYTYITGETFINNSVIGQENASNLATNSGGGLFNDGGRLEVKNSQVSFNQGELRGGGIFNYRGGTLLVEDSTLFNNFSEDGTAVKNEEATALIRGSTLEKNVGSRLEGGAIVNLRGRMEIYDSVLKNNETLVGSGGAIYNGSTSTLLLDNTTLEANKAAGVGGAIYNEVGADLLELRNGSKLMSNSAAKDGGAIFNGGQLKISADCQITQNTANTSAQTFKGGGLYNTGTLVDTSEAVLAQVVTGNQPDDIFTPPPGLRYIVSIAKFVLINKPD
jgi:hypothetical protein